MGNNSYEQTLWDNAVCQFYEEIDGVSQAVTDFRMGVVKGLLDSQYLDEDEFDYLAYLTGQVAYEYYLDIDEMDTVINEARSRTYV